MQLLTISGNIGKEPQLRSTQGGDQVLGFSVGVKQGYGERASTNWYRVSVWGKRAETLNRFLRKGTKVVVAGELSIGEYEGKAQFDIRANEVEFMTPREDGQRQANAPVGDGWDDAPLDDNVPF